jgi:hypothetical protein
MENNINNKNGLNSGWEAWDAVPRDGPAVFVVDTDALDRHQCLRGRWLDLAASPEIIDTALGELLGRPVEEAGWAIVDQIGLGPRMAPQVVSGTELYELPRLLATEDLA